MNQTKSNSTARHPALKRWARRALGPALDRLRRRSKNHPFVIAVFAEGGLALAGCF